MSRKKKKQASTLAKGKRQQKKNLYDGTPHYVLQIRLEEGSAVFPYMSGQVVPQCRKLIRVCCLRACPQLKEEGAHRRVLGWTNSGKRTLATTATTGRAATPRR